MEPKVQANMSPAVAAVLKELENLPASPAAGRALSFCSAGENQAAGALTKPDHILRILLTDLAQVVTPEAFSDLSPVDLEQYCLQTVLHNHSGSALLQRLIKAFLAGYGREHSTDQTLELLEQLEEIAASK
jgi:hypothetical protein